jgi:hypothetical protein
LTKFKEKRQKLRKRVGFEPTTVFDLVLSFTILRYLKKDIKFQRKYAELSTFYMRVSCDVKKGDKMA